MNRGLRGEEGGEIAVSSTVYRGPISLAIIPLVGTLSINSTDGFLEEPLTIGHKIDSLIVACGVTSPYATD